VPKEHLELTVRFHLTCENQYAPNERLELTACFQLTPQVQWAPQPLYRQFIGMGGKWLEESVWSAVLDIAESVTPFPFKEPKLSRG
jgi:hypothetical protein